jgi:hypothetical protein
MTIEEIRHIEDELRSIIMFIIHEIPDSERVLKYCQEMTDTIGDLIYSSNARHMSSERIIDIIKNYETKVLHVTLAEKMILNVN